MTNDALFVEKQKFNQWWLWMLMLALLGLFCHKVFLYYTAPNNVELIDILIFGCIVISIIILFLILRLDTIIKKDGVYVRFFPIHIKYRYFPWAELSKCYLRKYSPIMEFGGWGYRISLKGKAYTVSGNTGLQLIFINNKKLLIGTQKNKALEIVLESIERKLGRSFKPK